MAVAVSSCAKRGFPFAWMDRSIHINRSGYDSQVAATTKHVVLKCRDKYVSYIDLIWTCRAALVDMHTKTINLFLCWFLLVALLGAPEAPPRPYMQATKGRPGWDIRI
jgi:hypothetical protein